MILIRQKRGSAEQLLVKLNVSLQLCGSLALPKDLPGRETVLKGKK
jgi:hypothetical protein